MIKYQIKLNPSSICQRLSFTFFAFFVISLLLLSLSVKDKIFEISIFLIKNIFERFDVFQCSITLNILSWIDSGKLYN